MTRTPIAYIAKNCLVRWRTSLATVGCIALVTTVCLVLQMMVAGIAAATASTGNPENMIVVRKGSTAESTSQITRSQVARVRYMPQIAKDADGQPRMSADVVVLTNLPRTQNRGEANVGVRGITPSGKALRPQAALVQGRWFRPGQREVVVALPLSGRFENLGLGQSFLAGAHRLTVVGLFEAGTTSFASEIWMDADEARALFDRSNFSSLLLHIPDLEAQKSFAEALEQDKLLRLKALPEPEYYAAQTAAAAPIRALGFFLAATMSVGAVFAAMNTMYATVGRRTREVGTLRVLGFPRRAILLAFVAEGATLALVGGLAGCLAALPFQWMSTTAFSMDSFSELIYMFRLTPGLAAGTLVAAASVGALGSLLPAWKAARTPVIAALKAP